MRDKNKKPLRIYRLEGRGISKNENSDPSSIRRFFTTFHDNFGKLATVNLIMVLGNFPVFFFLVAYFAPFTSYMATLPKSGVFQNLFGILASEGTTPGNLALIGIEGIQSSVQVYNAWGYVFFALGALVLFTFGCVNVGTAYILRNIARGEPVFVKDDFLYAVKRNYKQAIPFGILDVLILFLLGFNIFSMVTTLSGFITSMLFWANVVVLILYFIMRFYIYVEMLTFDLSVFKILKNALIFTLVGIKRNVVAFLSILLVSVLILAILSVFPIAIGAPILIILPLTILLSAFAYIKVFASWFVIKEYMIDRYADESGGEAQDPGEPIMHDDVTEAERLAEIKRRNGISD